MVTLFRRNTGPAATLHPALGSEATAAALPAVAAGDLAAVAAAYAALDHDARTVFLEAMSVALPGPEDAAWAGTDPGVAATWVLRGTSLARAASDARGDDRAERTDPGRMLRFEELMRETRQVLLRAVELDDTDPGPWHQLLFTGYAEGRATILTDLPELRRRAPWDALGLRVALDVLGEKWYGLPGEARALAEEVAASAPRGSEAHVVMAFLLRDEWFHRSMFRNDRTGAAREITGPAARAALSTALDRSLRAAEHRPGEATACIRNQFAHVCTLAGDRDGAREQFDALDGLVTLWPWELFGDPVRGYEDARRRA
jgi:hypothetical protein